MINIPPPEIVDISSLKTDGGNPNKMDKTQLKRLKASIEKYGFIVPIITNKDLLIADGEQRWTIAKELNMDKVPVIRLPVEDVDRRLLRQVLNKLRGEHDSLLDAEEYTKIINAGHKEDLSSLLALDDDVLKYLLTAPPPVYGEPEISPHQSKSKPLNAIILSLGSFSSFVDRLEIDFDSLRDMTVKLDALPHERKVTIATEVAKFVKERSGQWLA